jgi:outer membrane protein OmpA-like peptidoglycan-associated protein
MLFCAAPRGWPAKPIMSLFTRVAVLRAFAGWVLAAAFLCVQPASAQHQASSVQVVGAGASRNAAPLVASGRKSNGYNSWEGSSGGIFVVDPGMGAPGDVQLQLAIDWFAGRAFLYSGDRVEQERQHLSVSWVVVERLQLYGSLQNRATTVAAAPGIRVSLHGLGDVTLGAKFGAALAPFLRVGLDARLSLRNDIEGRAWAWPTPSAGVRGSLALDLQRLANPAPFVVRLNLDYSFDGSARLFDDHAVRLPSRAERFGLGLGRADLFTLGWGIEVPLQLARWLTLQPIIDYRLGIPLGGSSCPRATAGMNQPDDACFDGSGPSFASWPMSLALGVRMLPALHGVSLLLGADLGLGGTTRFANEVAPTPPYRVLFAIAYGFDFDPRASLESPLQPRRKLLGRVHDKLSGAPLPGVLVQIRGSQRAALVSDAEGYFSLSEPPLGELEFELSEANHSPGRCAVVIAEGEEDVQTRCELGAWRGELKIAVRDQAGAPVSGAQLRLRGPSRTTTMTDAAGDATLGDLEPGAYELQVDSSAHLLQRAPVQIEPPHRKRLEISLVAKSLPSRVALRKAEIRAPELRFEPNSPQLRPDARSVVAELADLLLRNDSVERVRIQGHGAPELALTRAMVLKRALIEAGVDDSRVDIDEAPADRVVIHIVPSSPPRD